MANGGSKHSRTLAFLRFRHPAEPKHAARSRQQGTTTASGLDSVGLPVGVRCEQLLITFELAPLDEAFVVFFDDNLPLVKRLAMLIGRTCTPLDQRRALLAFAVGIGAGVERIFQDRDDAAITNRRPFEAHQLLAIGGARKVHLFSGQRQQYLACATVLTEAREDYTDCFLHPQVRIETQTEPAMPGVADRHADTQFTALRLAVFGIEHARTDHRELELADA